MQSLKAGLVVSIIAAGSAAGILVIWEGLDVSPLLPDSFAPIPGLGEADLKRIEGGNTLSYEIRLDEGRYLELDIEQMGADVVATFFDPEGRQIIEVDSPNGSYGIERIPLLTATGGRYRLALLSMSLTGSSGSLRLTRVTDRAASRRDRESFAAELDFAEAQGLERRGQAASLDEARHQYADLVDRWYALGLPSRAAATLMRRGDVERAMGWLDEALVSYQEALRIHDGPGLERAILVNRVGLVRFKQGDTESAVDLYRQSLALARAVGSPSDEAAAVHNLGQVLAATGRFREANRCYRDALDLFHALGQSHNEANALSNLGQSYSLLGETTHARDHLEQALVLIRRLGDRRGEGVTLNNLGLLAGRAGELRQAEARFLEALPILEETGHAIARARALNNLGWIRGLLPDAAPLAMAHFLDALELTRRGRDRFGEGVVRNNLGWLHDTRGDLLVALDHHKQSFDLFEAIDRPAHAAQALYGIAHVHRGRGELKSAQEAIEAALDRVELIRQDLAGGDLAMAFFATKRDLFTFYVELLMERHRYDPAAGFGRMAFEVSERSRARGFLDLLSEAGGPQNEEDSVWRREEEKIQAEINALQNQRRILARETPDPESGRVLARRLRELLARLGDLRARRRLGRFDLDTEPLDLEGIRRGVLDPETTLLHYQLGPSRSYVWVVTPSTFTVEALPSETEIEHIARAAFELLEKGDRRRHRAAMAEALEQLSEMVLRPIREALGTPRLLVVADGALASIPFGVLPLLSGPKGEAEPLLASFEVVHLPSASTLGLLRRAFRNRPLREQQSIAVIADPVYESDDPRLTGRGVPARPDARTLGRFARLEASRLEAEMIVELVPPARRFVALDLAASRQMVTSGRLAEYSILHFAVHGGLDTSEPELSALVFSLRNKAGDPVDGFVRMHEIRGLDLPAELVVLSSCRLALGRTIRGEGVVGLPRAFMAAGARSVVVAHWNVRDQPTAELMSRFYEELLVRGRAPAAALREAQLALFEDQRWSSPVHWGGFVFQGDFR